MRHRRKLGEDGLELRTGETDDGALVAHLVTVVGRGEDGDGLATVLHLVPFVLALVTAAAHSLSVISNRNLSRENHNFA